MTSTGDRPDPHHDPMPDEGASMPPEEHIDPAQVEEQLETEPEEARNATDGYAPDDDEAFEDEGADGV